MFDYSFLRVTPHGISQHKLTLACHKDIRLSHSFNEANTLKNNSVVAF